MRLLDLDNPPHVSEAFDANADLLTVFIEDDGSWNPEAGTSLAGHHLGQALEGQLGDFSDRPVCYTPELPLRVAVLVDALQEGEIL